MTMLCEGAGMNAPVRAAGLPTLPAKPIRVMIVDDSAVVRGLVSRWIEEESGLWGRGAPCQWQAGRR
jgi:hypothetical protein